MKNNNFWLLSLCALLILSENIELNIPLKIAILCNAIIVLIDVLKKAWRLHNERNKKKN